MKLNTNIIEVEMQSEPESQIGAGIGSDGRSIPSWIAMRCSIFYFTNAECANDVWSGSDDDNSILDRSIPFWNFSNVSTSSIFTLYDCGWWEERWKWVSNLWEFDLLGEIYWDESEMLLLSKLDRLSDSLFLTSFLPMMVLSKSST